ncbi:zinc-finger-containing protein [Lacrimispora amygdalina]|nr:zinc-finger-containing protein [Clostridium indicum]
MKKMKIQIECPYCKAKAILRPASVVYGSTLKEKGRHLYLCTNWPACDAYVSAHKSSLLPMGTLANGDLRHKRIMAHRALSAFQRHGHMETWAVYLWLQMQLGLSREEAHIGRFSAEQCEQVIAACRQAMKLPRLLSA